MKKVLKTLQLAEIIPYENNPRYNDSAVEAVRESIKQCNYIAPIIVDENNVILAGHTRYKALQSLDKKDVEVMAVTGLTEAQKKKYRLLDNKTNELADWDFELLEVELEDIDFEGFDFGFITEELFIDEADLDVEDEKNNVVVTINCGNVYAYEEIKERLQNLADEIGASLSIKMI